MEIENGRPVASMNCRSADPESVDLGFVELMSTNDRACKNTLSVLIYRKQDIGTPCKHSNKTGYLACTERGSARRSRASLCASSSVSPAHCPKRIMFPRTIDHRSRRPLATSEVRNQISGSRGGQFFKISCRSEVDLVSTAILPS